MARKAILLVEVAPGKCAEVCDCLRKLECVRSAYRVTPPYDIIAVLEGSSKDVNEDVRLLNQRVDGIIRVVVCPAVDFEPEPLVMHRDYLTPESPSRFRLDDRQLATHPERPGWR